MAKRSRRAASAGQDARSERPATGMGSPEPDTRASITCEPYDLVARSCPLLGLARWPQLWRLLIGLGVCGLELYNRLKHLFDFHFAIRRVPPHPLKTARFRRGIS